MRFQNKWSRSIIALIGLVFLQKQAHASETWTNQVETQRNQIAGMIQDSSLPCTPEEKLLLRNILASDPSGAEIVIEGDSIAAISDWQMIRITRLQDAAPESIAYLRCLTPLKELHLSHVNAVEFLPLKYLKSLETLSLNHTNIEDLKSIRALRSLTSLILTDNPNLKDISGIIPLIFLENLEIIDSRAMNDLFGVNALSSLERVTISHSGITDFSALSELTRLKALTVDSNYIQSVDSLNRFQNLEEINLASNCVKTMPEIDKSMKLTTLEVSDNLIEVLPEIRIRSLKYIDFRSNPIKDIAGIGTWSLARDATFALTSAPSRQLKLLRRFDAQLKVNVTNLDYKRTMSTFDAEIATLLDIDKGYEPVMSGPQLQLQLLKNGRDLTCSKPEKGKPNWLCTPDDCMEACNHRTAPSDGVSEKMRPLTRNEWLRLWSDNVGESRWNQHFLVATDERSVLFCRILGSNHDVNCNNPGDSIAVAGKACACAYNKILPLDSESMKVVTKKRNDCAAAASR